MTEFRVWFRDVDGEINSVIWTGCKDKEDAARCMREFDERADEIIRVEEVEAGQT